MIRTSSGQGSPAVANWTAIDFETACPQSASACAVGLVRIRDGQPVESFYSLIKPPPGMEIWPRFTEIHGIRNADVTRAPDFAQLWPRLAEFIGQDHLVAHNSPFDRGVLSAALAYYGINWAVPPFECTVKLSRRAWPRLLNHKLSTVAQHLGIALQHHEALSDAQACARIFLAAGKA